MHTSFLVSGIVAYYVVYDKVEWTIAEVTTSDVFLFSCSGRHLALWRQLLACRGDRPAVVRLLLEFKANPDCADNDGRTPLHHACMYVPGADY